MRLVLVHGRSQQEKDPADLREKWMTGLRKGAEAAGVSLPDVEVRFPYYGDRLDELTELLRKPVERALERGGAAGAAVDEFQLDLLMAMKKESGITDAEVKKEADLTATEMGAHNLEFVQAVGRLLSRRFGWLSSGVLARFLADVDAYLNYPNVTLEINKIVRADLEGVDRAVVVGHSLGSVVTYQVLTHLGGSVDIPLFVTAGSPLGIDAVKKKLRPPPLAIPPRISAWLNAADEEDVVALFSRLDSHTFVGGIDNISDVRNPDGEEHSIEGYLADPRVAKQIAAALAS